MIRLTSPSLPVLREQRKIEKLLVMLANAKPISAKPAPIATGRSATQMSDTANGKVYFST